MAQDEQTLQPSYTVTICGPTNDSAALWRDFSTRWANWLARVNPSEPIYALPEEVITRLEMPLCRGRTVVGEIDAQAERRLAEICRQVNSIGFWQNQPIVYPPLTPRPSRTDLENYLQAYPPSARLECLALREKADEMSLRIAGYAGWLRTEPAFLGEVQALARHWNQLPHNERPAFPLCRVLAWPLATEKAFRASDATAQFVQEVGKFLDRWSLMELTTWDLPHPQGPLLSNVVPLDSPAMPKRGIHIVLPSYFPLQGADGLHRQVLLLQQQTARDQGQDTSMAGLSHFEAYEKMLHVIHLEQILVNRYGGGSRPPGFMTGVEEAIAEAVNCKIDNVNKLRKGISQCQRGKRASVRWLQ